MRNDGSTCPSCAEARPPWHRFCSLCGRAIARACPACGSPAAPEDAFCGGCGESLAEAPRTEKTRRVDAEAPAFAGTPALDVDEILSEVAALRARVEADRSMLEQSEIDDLFATDGGGGDASNSRAGRDR